MFNKVKVKGPRALSGKLHAEIIGIERFFILYFLNVLEHLLLLNKMLAVS